MGDLKHVDFAEGEISFEAGEVTSLHAVRHGFVPNSFQGVGQHRHAVGFENSDAGLIQGILGEAVVDDHAVQANAVGFLPEG